MMVDVLIVKLNSWRVYLFLLFSDTLERAHADTLSDAFTCTHIARERQEREMRERQERGKRERGRGNVRTTGM